MVDARRCGILLAIVLPLLWSSMCRAAQPEAEHAAAVESFRRGTQLVETGKLQQAIEAFREALGHDPASVGARLDLADCYEKIGSPGSAWREYAIAEAYARKASDSRREMARASGAHLEASLLLLTLRGQRVAGMEIRVDGEPVAPEIMERGVIALAPGRHRVDLDAPEKTPNAQSVSGGAGETRDLTIAFDAEPAPAPLSEPERSSTQRTWGIAVGVLGLGGTALGAVAGAIAVSDKSNLEQEAHEATVGSARFYADRSTADTFANVSTAAFIAGGAALVAGVSLYLTAPSSSGRTLRATLGPAAGGSTAALLTGTF